MKILHFVSMKTNHASGLSFSIPNLIKGQNEYSSKKSAFLFNTINGINLKKSNLKQFEIIILHSFFYPDYIKLLLFISREKKIIICPRGTFNRLNNYSKKKLIYSFVFFSIIKFRKLNISFHFLTKNEQKQSRFHVKNEFVVGNSIEVNNNQIGVNEDCVYEKFNSKLIVFIGRFALRHKALDILFNNLISNQDIIVKHGYKFSFYGPESADKELFKQTAKNNNLNFITFHKEVYGREKELIYGSAMFHILASRFEGFPMSILESASMGTPQILSKGTNLQDDMLKNNFGIAFENSFIEKITTIKFESYKTMNQNALSFAKQHSLISIGNKTIDNYKKIQ